MVHCVVVVVVVVEVETINEYYLGGIIALLLQDHRTISTKSVEAVPGDACSFEIEQRHVGQASTQWP